MFRLLTVTQKRHFLLLWIAHLMLLKPRKADPISWLSKLRPAALDLFEEGEEAASEAKSLPSTWCHFRKSQ